jgi:hypothetical protein
LLWLGGSQTDISIKCRAPGNIWSRLPLEPQLWRHFLWLVVAISVLLIGIQERLMALMIFSRAMATFLMVSGPARLTSFKHKHKSDI